MRASSNQVGLEAAREMLLEADILVWLEKVCKYDLMYLSAEAIRAETGFSLWMSLPNWHMDNGVSFIESIDQQAALADQIGPENVVGSFYVEDEQLLLGIFVHHEKIIDGELVARGLPHAQRAIGQ